MARRKLGQHFLIKGSILDRIAAAVCPTHQERVIEIGPGRGALTTRLLRRANSVIAIELDPMLADYLRRKFTEEPRLEIIEADVLAVDLAQWGHVPIAGNLPYFITSPILEKTVHMAPPRAVYLIQKEVADRLIAPPGSRDYGFLTVATCLFADVRLLFEVRPTAFHPPPKVDSAAVLLEPRSGGPSIPEPEKFLGFASQCFRHKRKTIRNNLAERYGRAFVEAWPEAHLRAEQLSLEQFAEMWGRVRAEPLAGA